jgi:GNAT superfamily N-acetyltransferase
MAKIVLRPFVLEEARALAVLWDASWRSTGIATATSATLDELSARIDREVAAGWIVTVAEAERELIGFAAVRLADAVLDQLFVAPSWKRRGVGKQLFDHARHQMPDGFWLRTAEANVEARRFYEQNGMRLVQLESHPVYGYETAIYRIG